MWKQKIGISLGNDYSRPTTEVIALLKKIGFDAVSPEWMPGDAFYGVLDEAKRVGLTLQSLHAPYSRAADMWSRDESVSTPAKEELAAALNCCKKFNIPILVVHTWIGFDYSFDGENLFFGNFDGLVAKAKENGIKIAFENTEGEEYLFALMEHFKDDGTVGFCWDSGHEMCYNHSRDLLEKFGDRLIMTHLNDNLGISRFDGKIFWTDDLHLLPYDGVADWDYNILRLKASKKMPILNFELVINSKPDRYDNEIYSKMPIELYFTEAYKRACRIAYRYAD